MSFKPLNAKGHGLSDWGFAVSQWVLPMIFLKGRARVIAMGFGLFTGIVNALTDQPYAVKRAIPLRTHGKLETPLLPALLAVPLAAGVLSQPRGRRYFVPLFALACANYLLTDYNADQTPKWAGEERKKRQLIAGAAARNPHHAVS